MDWLVRHCNILQFLWLVVVKQEWLIWQRLKGVVGMWLVVDDEEWCVVEELLLIEHWLRGRG